MAVLILGCFAVQFSVACLPGLDSLVNALHAGLHMKAILISKPYCSMRALRCHCVKARTSVGPLQVWKCSRSL